MIDPIRTDMLCTNCSKNFIAQLDMGLDGNHIVECPYCAHEHCRVIKAGVVTGDRWETRAQRHDVDKRSVWKCDSQPIVTSMASAFIREKWLNRGWQELPSGIAMGPHVMTYREAAELLTRTAGPDWYGDDYEGNVMFLMDYPGDALSQVFKYAARVAHPDTGGDTEAFKQITEARRILEAE